ncbi:MAG: hypothetical protein K8S55_02935 [Phycisphaerae bacterium]|nr:hypothetical protein [Phycisphaerae bacterium]
MAKLKWATHADMAIKRNPTVFRDEYLDYMTFKRNDRPLFTEIFGPMIGLKEKWEEQGATPEELDFSAFTYRCSFSGAVPVNTGWMGPGTKEVLEDNDEYLLYRDGMGRTMKLPKGFATLPLPLDFPVKNMDDWLKLKPHYEFSEERFGKDWEKVARELLQNGRVVVVSMPGGYSSPRDLLGDEVLCMAYYDQPELMHDMLKTFGDTAVKVLDRVSAAVQVDYLSVHEDMAGKSGPLAGPNQIKEFIAPYYRRVWDMLADRGVRIFDQDSDGNMNAVIDVFLDAGVNCMHPMEPGSGMDIVKIREKYGQRLAFYGGLDKYVLSRSKEEIAAELEYKIPPMVATGGCVLGLDHRVPENTPLENYRFYIQKVWEILNRETAT